MNKDDDIQSAIEALKLTIQVVQEHLHAKNSVVKTSIDTQVHVGEDKEWDIV